MHFGYKNIFPYEVLLSINALNGWLAYCISSPYSGFFCLTLRCWLTSLHSSLLLFWGTESICAFWVGSGFNFVNRDLTVHFSTLFMMNTVDKTILCACECCEEKFTGSHSYSLLTQLCVPQGLSNICVLGLTRKEYNVFISVIFQPFCIRSVSWETDFCEIWLALFITRGKADIQFHRGTEATHG